MLKIFLIILLGFWINKITAFILIKNNKCFEGECHAVTYDQFNIYLNIVLIIIFIMIFF